MYQTVGVSGHADRMVFFFNFCIRNLQKINIKFSKNKAKSSLDYRQHLLACFSFLELTWFDLFGIFCA